MERDARLRAVEAAYASYADDMYRVAYAILHDPEDAMDATQETFVRAFERWDRYDPERPLRPWLHTIVSRLALDRLRRRRVRWLAISAVSRDVGSGHDDEYAGRDPAITVTGRQAVEELLAHLSPVARAAVVLRHRYGYDYGEIADLLGTSRSNVGAILSRARARLRDRVSPTAPDAAVRETEA